ncbi:hypothetical protein [Undibacterium terreum]|uniref:Uncharacterized protein n=1 Tax=Undibacterium terreum TaxID=1224302 RepID=A0A916UMA2_9BURK|nr:hypothetical protein [Undibacterium terreum]GGC78066.1 hypothetical protein GCM10011396_26580 [Undibacterium terreum]
MKHQDRTLKEVGSLIVQVWREAGGFFKSIEVWLMLLMSVALVVGVGLAFMGDLSCLLFFGVVIAYFSVRPILHLKGILRWPFF